MAVFFPFFPGARYDYETRFDGDISNLWWTVREIPEGASTAYSFPVEDSDYADNDYWGGHAFQVKQTCLYVSVAPGAPFELVADVSAGQGSQWDLPSAGRHYRHLGYEDVVVPAGRYANCFKLQMNEHLPSEDETPRLSTAYLYFAEDIGLVKVGFPDGEIVLKAYHMEAQAAPPPPRRPTQDSVIGAHPDGPRQSQASKPGKKKRRWWPW